MGRGGEGGGKGGEAPQFTFLATPLVRNGKLKTTSKKGHVRWRAKGTPNMITQPVCGCYDMNEEGVVVGAIVIHFITTPHCRSEDSSKKSPVFNESTKVTSSSRVRSYALPMLND